MSAIKLLSGLPTHTDGLKLGKTGEKVSLFGVTPVVQPVGANQAAVSTAAIAAAAGANPTKAEYDALVTRFNSALLLLDAQRTALVALGAIKGAA